MLFSLSMSCYSSDVNTNARDATIPVTVCKPKSADRLPNTTPTKCLHSPCHAFCPSEIA